MPPIPTRKKGPLLDSAVCPHRNVLPATGVCADCWGLGVPHYSGHLPPGSGVQVQCLDVDGRCVHHPKAPASWCIECQGGWRNIRAEAA
jgi:hypothetical protein